MGKRNITKLGHDHYSLPNWYGALLANIISVSVLSVPALLSIGEYIIAFWSPSNKIWHLIAVVVHLSRWVNVTNFSPASLYFDKNNDHTSIKGVELKEI